MFDFCILFHSQAQKVVNPSLILNHHKVGYVGFPLGELILTLCGECCCQPFALPKNVFRFSLPITITPCLTNCLSYLYCSSVNTEHNVLFGAEDAQMNNNQISEVIKCSGSFH
jgi:hypothetical protein